MIITLRLPDHTDHTDHTDRIRINNTRKQKFMEKIYPEDLQEIKEIYPKDSFPISWITHTLVLFMSISLIMLTFYCLRLHQYVRNIGAVFGLRHNLWHQYFGGARAQPIIMYQNEPPTVTIDMPE